MKIVEMKELKIEYAKLAMKLRERGLVNAAIEVEKQSEYWADMEVDTWLVVAETERRYK